MQTWYCVPCRKRYRQPQAGRPVVCPTCRRPCERTLGFRVPSPKRIKAWDTFWDKYRAERELVDAYGRGEIRHAIQLELFDVKLPKRRQRKRRTSAGGPGVRLPCGNPVWPGPAELAATSAQVRGQAPASRGVALGRGVVPGRFGVAGALLAPATHVPCFAITEAKSDSSRVARRNRSRRPTTCRRC